MTAAARCWPPVGGRAAAHSRARWLLRAVSASHSHLLRVSLLTPQALRMRPSKCGTCAAATARTTSAARLASSGSQRRSTRGAERVTLARSAAVDPAHLPLRRSSSSMVQFGPEQSGEALTLFSGSDDNLIREWDLKTSKCVKRSSGRPASRLVRSAQLFLTRCVSPPPLKGAEEVHRPRVARSTAGV